MNLGRDKRFSERWTHLQNLLCLPAAQFQEPRLPAGYEQSDEMKNQYFGDINDFLKYGLLRALVQETDMCSFVTWMLAGSPGS